MEKVLFPEMDESEAIAAALLLFASQMLESYKKRRGQTQKKFSNQEISCGGSTRVLLKSSKTKQKKFSSEFLRECLPSVLKNYLGTWWKSSHARTHACLSNFGRRALGSNPSIPRPWWQHEDFKHNVSCGAQYSLYNCEWDHWGVLECTEGCIHASTHYSYAQRVEPKLFRPMAISERSGRYWYETCPDH